MSPLSGGLPVSSIIKPVESDLSIYEVFDGKEISAAVLTHAVDIYNDIFIRLGLEILEKYFLASDPLKHPLIMDILRHETSMAPH